MTWVFLIEAISFAARESPWFTFPCESRKAEATLKTSFLIRGFISIYPLGFNTGETEYWALSKAEIASALAKSYAFSCPLPFKIPAKPLQILGDIVEKICVPLKIEPPIHRRRVDFFTKDRSFDISKARKELGFMPEHTFEEEVHIVGSWYKEYLETKN